MVRVFIGVVIPVDAKRYIMGILKQLSSLPIKAKFVEPENFHISLSFLGDLEDSEIEKVKFKLDEIVKSYGQFEIILDGILSIPNEKFARVIALDVKSDALESIRKAVAKDVGGKSHPAHLTLARVKAINGRAKIIETIDKIVYNETHIKINSICLIESVLGGNRPVYTIIHKSHLK